MSLGEDRVEEKAGYECDGLAPAERRERERVNPMSGEAERGTGEVRVWSEFSEGGSISSVCELYQRLCYAAMESQLE